jgi:hypothetical protein
MITYCIRSAWIDFGSRKWKSYARYDIKGRRRTACVIGPGQFDVLYTMGLLNHWRTEARKLHYLSKRLKRQGQTEGALTNTKVSLISILKNATNFQPISYLPTLSLPCRLRAFGAELYGA